MSAPPSAPAPPPDPSPVNAPVWPAPAPEETELVDELSNAYQIIYHMLEDDLLTQEDMEESLVDDSGEVYAGDEYAVNAGYRWNRYIERWIDRENLP